MPPKGKRTKPLSKYEEEKKHPMPKVEHAKIYKKRDLKFYSK